MTTTSRPAPPEHARSAPPVAPPAPAGDAPRPPTPRRFARRTVATRIRECSTACVTAETRAALHALWRAARRGAGTPRRVTALDAAINATLDEADRADADRWSAAEAAVWGLSLLTRGKRRAAGSAAGRHLERLVRFAREAEARLGDRDTRPARFASVLAGVFADVEACRPFESSAAAACDEEIGRLVTPDGSVVLGGSVAVIERVARWASVRTARRALGAQAWGDDTERRWRAAAANVLRLLGARGRAQAAIEPAAAVPGLLREIAATGGSRVRRTVRAMRRGGTAAARLLPTDLHDAAAATAVVRTGWTGDAVRVLLEYRDAVPRLEIACGDRLLVDGAWDWSVSADGRPLDAEGAWTVSGWESDRKAAFLEIVAPLAGGMRLERQIVVLRQARIVLLADAIVPADEGAAGCGSIGHRAAVPLAAGLEAEPAAETREVLVYDGGMRLTALPLALPEWRAAGSGGLAPAAGRLVLEQSGHRRLYAPLWLDCDPRRVGRPLTWRQLTVADTRRNLPPHQAAGFRVQSGHEQWLLYRALDAVRNRTLLGCNVSCGFLLGRVKRSGEVARTVEIE